ncbi:hypothetical protein HFN89_05950 [Rhizobium laguerreae]|nr:hypothetical protein [Rhizobium laguerreae]
MHETFEMQTTRDRTLSATHNVPIVDQQQAYSVVATTTLMETTWKRISRRDKVGARPSKRQLGRNNQTFLVQRKTESLLDGTVAMTVFFGTSETS